MRTRRLPLALPPLLAGCWSPVGSEPAPTFLVAVRDNGAESYVRWTFVVDEPDGPACHHMRLTHAREGSVLTVRVGGHERMEPCSTVALPPKGGFLLDVPDGTYTLRFAADARTDVYRLILASGRAELVPVTTTFTDVAPAAR